MPQARRFRRRRETAIFPAGLGDDVPRFLPDVCMDCGGCVGICPHDSIDLFRGLIQIRASCTECDLCVRLCPVGALTPSLAIDSMEKA